MKRGETLGYGTTPAAMPMVTFVHTALTNQKPTTTRRSATARSGRFMGVAMLGESPGLVKEIPPGKLESPREILFVGGIWPRRRRPGPGRDGPRRPSRRSR